MVHTTFRLMQLSGWMHSGNNISIGHVYHVQKLTIILKLKENRSLQFSFILSTCIQPMKSKCDFVPTKYLLLPGVANYFKSFSCKRLRS